jgi:hypothetical protein
MATRNMNSKVNNGKAEWLPLAAVTAVVASSAVGVLAWYIWTNQQQQQQQRQIRIQVPRNLDTSPLIKELMCRETSIESSSKHKLVLDKEENRYEP